MALPLRKRRCLITGTSTTCQELQLWNSTVFCTSGPQLSARNGHEDDLVQELHQKRLCMITGTSTTSDELRKQTSTNTATAVPPQFSARRNQMHLSSKQRALPPCSRTAPVVATTGTATLFKNCTCRRSNGHVHLVQELPRTLNELQLRNTTVFCTVLVQWGFASEPRHTATPCQ